MPEAGTAWENYNPDSDLTPGEHARLNAGAGAWDTDKDRTRFIAELRDKYREGVYATYVLDRYDPESE
jgi:hypothetical protein